MKLIHTLCFDFSDLDMSIAYWNIILEGRFKFLDIWCEFLLVSWIDVSVNQITELNAMNDGAFETNYITWYKICLERMQKLPKQTDVHRLSLALLCVGSPSMGIA